MTESSINMEIIDIAYTPGPDGRPIIEIFGRTSEGKSATVLYEGFEPYCYFQHNEITTGKILRERKDIIMHHEIINLEHMLETKPYVKVYTRTPTDVRTLRKRYEDETTFMSADILFPLRFMYDMDLGHYISSSGEIKTQARYSTDLVLQATKITNIPPFRQGLSTLSFDIETSLMTNTILTIGVHIEHHDGSVDQYKLCDEETKMLTEFFDIIQLTDPDIITGYNIIFYDLPKIEERANHHKMKVNICRDGSSMWGRKGNDDRKHYIIKGRVIADAWLHTKILKKPHRETLDYVAHEYLGEGKLDVDRKNIDGEWERDREHVIEYCLKDAELAYRILKYIKVVDKSVALATVANLPLTTAFENRTSSLADSLLIRMADRQGYAVPCTNEYQAEEKIQGAYVKQPNPGVYEWVVVLDFKGMYPSIMMQHNLCATTYAPEVGDIISPTGAHFLSPDVREGMVPKIMKKLQIDRQRCKDELKKAKKENAPQNIIDFWDDLQYSIKVLANSFYGLFTSSFYRFTNRAIGESITAFARENILHVNKQLESEGLNVIYNDTDSIFIISPHDNIEQTVEFGTKISKQFSTDMYELEFDKVLRRWFTHGKKKRYFGKVIWPAEDLYVRGYETRRKDSFDALTDTLEEMFNVIMDGKSDAAMSLARTTVKDVKNGKIPIDKLVISKSCRPEDQYTNPESLPQVQCARKLRDMGELVAPYMSVAWIVTNSRKTPIEVEPYLSSKKFIRTPDWDYYATRLSQAFGRITEVFGWDEDRLYSGQRQCSIDNF